MTQAYLLDKLEHKRLYKKSIKMNNLFSFSGGK